MRFNRLGSDRGSSLVRLNFICLVAQRKDLFSRALASTSLQEQLFHRH